MKHYLTIFLLLPFVALAAQTNDVPELIPAYSELPPSFWQQHKLAVILAGFLFIIVQTFILWKLLMRLQPVVEPVENLTRAALVSLLNEPEDGKLLSEVSRILRGYFGKQFQMSGEEATTAEFVAALAGNRKIPADLGEKVSSFLRECDARKFSPANVAKELDAAERALELVNAAENLRAGKIAANA